MGYTAPSNQIVYNDDGEKITVVPSPAWEQIQQLIGFNSLKSGCFLFMHERISKGGAHRLVAVSFDRIRVGSDPPWSDVEAISVEQQSLSEDANTDIFMLQEADLGWQIPPRSNLRFYAGQCDPADASHFTIMFESDGKKRTIDGWLLDDPSAVHVRIKLAVRKAPVAGNTQ